MFPAADAALIDHAWSGVLGVPRDWRATVNYDRATGLGFAGGYVGTGFTAAAAMPWVNRTVRRWEPEPLRWLAVKGMYGLYHRADAQEADGRMSTSPLARLANRISGR